MERKIILNLAISIDGYIADEHGGYDWIKGHDDKTQNTDNNFSYSKFLDSIDTIIMGRKAYEDCGLEGFDEKKIIVVTSMAKEDYENVSFINKDICNYVQELQKSKGKDIWLFGGGGLTDNFMKKNIIDKFIIGIIPTILGKGRPLFLPNNPKIELHLDECTIDDGITILEYSKR